MISIGLAGAFQAPRPRPRHDQPARDAKRFRTVYQKRRYAIEAREARKKAGVCICGPLIGTVGSRRGVEHGPVVGSSGKCQRCLDVHARSS